MLVDKFIINVEKIWNRFGINFEDIPEDYDVEFHNGTTNVPLSDTVEIDVSGKRILFKS